jgi:hypothetical protein
MAQLLSNLPIGTKVKFGKYSVNGEVAQAITWVVADKNHNGYPTNSVTLVTEKIIDLRCFDAQEPENSQWNLKNFGDRRYDWSNIDQWLNKDNGANEWYTAAHTVDGSPDTSEKCGSVGTQYANRPGFLNAFSQYEKNAILLTTIETLILGEIQNLNRKVFIPSRTEVNLGNERTVGEGEKLAYFETFSRGCTLSSQAYNNSLSTTKPAYTTAWWGWWVRTPYWEEEVDVRVVNDVGKIGSARPRDGSVGVRPMLNLSATVKVSDTIDNDGDYTCIWNAAPPAPTTLSTPTIYGGKSNAISWSSVNDPDGDAVTYQLECSINGGNYSQIYSGTSTVYAHLVPFGTTSVAYRVKATDPSGATSAYKTSATITVINNNAPVISGTDSNLGVKSSGFTGTYTVTDANNNTVTVTESIDGVQIRSLVATLGATITYGITGNTWLALPNGSHTLTIRATDGIDSTVRTYTFTKLVETLEIQNSTPWVSSTMPTRIMLVITRNIPPTATFKVEVCNNGFDASPTWEDCTDAVTSGLVHVLTNKTKTASNWGVLVKVTVARNGATGACYISAIGGNFE